MLYATYVKAPIFGATVESADLAAAKSVKGVRDAFVIDGESDSLSFLQDFKIGLLPGVAVVADSWWAACKGREKLAIGWASHPTFKQSSNGFSEQAQSLLASGKGQSILRKDGDFDLAFRRSEQQVSATYAYPFLAHGAMEPMNCTAEFSNGKLDVWVPTQNAQMAREQCAATLSMNPDDIAIHATRSGGSFGRRWYADFVLEAAWIARKMGTAVKLIWTREDDIQHDLYRPAGFHSLRAGLDKKGNILAWNQHFVTFSDKGKVVALGELGTRKFPAQFVPHLLYEQSMIPLGVPTGPLRAPGDNALAFVHQSFIDELAHAARQDPLAFQLNLLDRGPPPGRIDGSFNADRMKRVLRAAGEMSGWGKQKLPTGEGMGIACCFSHAGYFAEVAHVAVSGGGLTVKKIWCAADVGSPIVNISGAINQVQGAILFGLSHTLHEEITIAGGRVVQSNFSNYSVLRLPEAPEIDVQFLKTAFPPTGLGEPALPPAIPAVTNAIFSATGKRIRTLPIKPAMLTSR